MSVLRVVRQRSAHPRARDPHLCVAVRAFAAIVLALCLPALQPASLRAGDAGATDQAVGIDPVELRVPAAGIDAAVQDVGLEPDGSMGVPSNFEDVAWFSAGYRPGEYGHAVFDGHVSSTDAAAVFYHVEDLHRGQSIYVSGEDGSVLTFRVTDVKSYPMNDTPLDEIFGASERPQLVLITCGGDWHPDIHLFDHRTIVFSSIVSPPPELLLHR